MVTCPKCGGSGKLPGWDLFYGEHDDECSLCAGIGSVSSQTANEFWENEKAAFRAKLKEGVLQLSFLGAPALLLWVVVSRLDRFIGVEFSPEFICFLPFLYVMLLALELWICFSLSEKH